MYKQAIIIILAVFILWQNFGLSDATAKDEQSWEMSAQIYCEDVTWDDGDILMDGCVIEDVDFDEN